MEAFFRNDREIQEWIDLFIEKLFTVSLLSGNDADSEFYQGRQAVEKIVLFFQEMVELPEEALVDGIRQLVEQRLPDPRVIENFPNFYQLMNEMILSGFPSPLAVPAMQTTSRTNPSLNQTSTLSQAEVSSPAPSSKVVLNGGWIPIPCTQDATTLPVSLRQHLLNPINSGFDELELPDQHSPFTELHDQDLQDHDLHVDTLSGHETLNKVIPYTKPSEQNSEPLPISDTDLIFEQISENLSESLSEHRLDIIKDDPISVMEDTSISKSMSTPDQMDILVNPEVEFSPKSASITTEPTTNFPLPRRDPFRFNPRKVNSGTVSNPVPVIPPRTKSSTKSLSHKSEITSNEVSQDQKTSHSRKLQDVRTSQIPQDGDRLAQVLKRYFPNSAIRWNAVIGKNTFYAQVDKVLVYIQETSSEQEAEDIRHLKTNMKKEGWSIYICLKGDLLFPRRLERGLRQVMR